MIDRPLLVAITDLSRLAVSVESWAMAVYEGGVDIIQVRMPGAERCDLAAITHRIVLVAPGPERVQVNGDLLIARSRKCGIHLPEREPPVRPPHSPASRAVHSLESARQSGGFDFVVAGHVFATAGKPGQPGRGLDWLRDLADSSPVPVVGIGGIDASNAAEVIAAGANGIAVISALSDAADPRRAASGLRAAIDHAMADRGAA